MSEWEDYYELLEVSPRARLSVIKAAYRRLADEYHPDKGGSNEQMAKLNAAIEIFSNPAKRSAYDNEYRRRKGWPSASTASGGRTSSHRPSYAGSSATAPPPPSYDPIIEVDQSEVNMESEEGQPVRFRLRVRHVGGSLPPRWSLGVKMDSKFLDDARVQMVPPDGFPATVTVELPTKEVGDYVGSIELSILELA